MSVPASDPFKWKRDRLGAGDKPLVLDICGGAWGCIFNGAMNAAFRQIGNGEPPLLAFALAVEIMRALRAMTESGVPSCREAAE
jgi:hypothetical protein